MSWLSVFRNVLHAVETAAQLAAPFVAIVNPVVGGLINQAVAAAVGVEAIAVAMPTPMTGDQKAAVVAAGTAATVDAINGILVSRGKVPLPPTTVDTVQATVKTVVIGLQAVGRSVADPAVTIISIPPGVATSGTTTNPIIVHQI